MPREDERLISGHRTSKCYSDIQNHSLTLPPWFCTPALHCHPSTGAPQSREGPGSGNRTQTQTLDSQYGSSKLDCMASSIAPSCQAVGGQGEEPGFTSRTDWFTCSGGSWISWYMSPILGKVSFPLKVRTVLTFSQGCWEDPVEEGTAEGLGLFGCPLNARVLLFVC